ncbi:MAG: hypothetical protein SGARI_005763, partial [Bacillariaceae sp.]
MPPNDETYLEAAIEHISAVPHEIRRNLALIQDLDQSGSTLMQEMNRLQTEYLQQVEEKIGSLEIVEGRGVRVNAATASAGASSDSKKSAEVVIPTTEEFVRYVSDPEALAKIEAVQTDCLQRSEEKVAISDQTLTAVDNICRRLDSDILEMEKVLLTTGEFQTPGSGKANDLAAIQTPGSTDWILAKVISFDPQSGMYKLSDEDVESNK